MADASTKPELELSRNRLITGIAVFVIGHSAPLAIPLVTSSSLSTGWKTALSGLMIFGIPELMTLLAVVVLGKAGFNAVKALVFGWLAGSHAAASKSFPATLLHRAGPVSNSFFRRLGFTLLI